MEKASHTGLFIETIDGEYLQCYAIYGKHLGLNARYEFQILGLTQKPLQPTSITHAILHITHASAPLYIQAVLLSCSQTMTENGYNFDCLFGSPLHQLDNISRQAIYIKQTPIEITASLLTLYDLSYQFDLKKTYTSIDYIAQGGVSDYDFLLQLCQEYGLIFYFRHDNDHINIYITDEYFSGEQHIIPFNPGNGLVNKCPAATAITHSYTVLPDTVHIYGCHQQKPGQIFFSEAENTTNVAGNGPIYLSLPHRFTSQDDCDAKAASLQTQLDWQRQWLIVEINHVKVEPGDLITLYNHPNPSINTLYRVITLDCSISIQDNADNHPYRSHVYLIPANIRYQMPERILQAETYWSLEDKHLPHSWHQIIEYPLAGLQRGVLNGETQQSPLDAHGRYEASFFFAAREERQAQSQYPLMQLQTASGPFKNNYQGMQFPLLPGTHVIIGHLYGCVNLPFILGALPGIEHRPVVQETNRQQLAIQGQYGSALIFEDTPLCQKIHLHTEKNQHGLSMVKQDSLEAIYVKSLGKMTLHSHDHILWKSAHDLNLKNKHGFYHAREDVNMVTQQSCTIKAEENIEFSASNRWLLTCQNGSITCNSMQTCRVEAGSLSIKADGVHIQSRQGYIYAQTSHTMLADKSLQLGLHTSKINITPGILHLNAPQICMIAPQILKQSISPSTH